MADPPEVPASVLVVARALRILTFGATLSASVVMATSYQTATVPNSNVILKVDYKDLACFKVFFGANIAASVYCLVVAAIPANSLLWRPILVLDVILCSILTSIDSVAVAAAYLLRNGESQAYWLPICSYVSKYCNHVMGAVAVGFLGVGVYLIIIVYTISVILQPLLMM